LIYKNERCTAILYFLCTIVPAKFLYSAVVRIVTLASFALDSWKQESFQVFLFPRPGRPRARLYHFLQLWEFFWVSD
jgi:hypothetical protein